MFEGVGSLWVHSYPQGARAMLSSAVEMIQHTRIRDKARTTMAAIYGKFLQALGATALRVVNPRQSWSHDAFLLPKLPQLGSHIERGRLTADTYTISRVLGLCFQIGES